MSLARKDAGTEARSHSQEGTRIKSTYESICEINNVHTSTEWAPGSTLL